MAVNPVDLSQVNSFVSSSLPEENNEVSTVAQAALSEREQAYLSSLEGKKFQLHRAVREKDIEKIAELLTKDPDSSREVDDQGLTPYKIAELQVRQEKYYKTLNAILKICVPKIHYMAFLLERTEFDNILKNRENPLHYDRFLHMPSYYVELRSGKSKFYRYVKECEMDNLQKIEDSIIYEEGDVISCGGTIM